jgi:hypothetical protein
MRSSLVSGVIVTRLVSAFDTRHPVMIVCTVALVTEGISLGMPKGPNQSLSAKRRLIDANLWGLEIDFLESQTRWLTFTRPHPPSRSPTNCWLGCIVISMSVDVYELDFTTPVIASCDSML